MIIRQECAKNRRTTTLPGHVFRCGRFYYLSLVPIFLAREEETQERIPNMEPNSSLKPKCFMRTSPSRTHCVVNSDCYLTAIFCRTGIEMSTQGKRGNAANSQHNTYFWGHISLALGKHFDACRSGTIQRMHSFLRTIRMTEVCCNWELIKELTQGKKRKTPGISVIFRSKFGDGTSNPG